MFCDLSPYQSRRCKEIIEGKVENSENVRGLIEFIDAKFKTRAISAFYGAGRDSAWLKIVLRFDKDAAKITDKKCIERYLARTPLYAKLNELKNFYISVESFESQIRTDLIQGAVEELLRNRSELLTPLKNLVYRSGVRRARSFLFHEAGRGAPRRGRKDRTADKKFYRESAGRQISEPHGI